MKDVADKIDMQAFGSPNMTGTIMKIDVVSRTTQGGYHLDITLDNGALVEVAVSEDKFNLVNSKIFEPVFFIVRPLEEQNRYEGTCMVFGKAPEYVN